MKTTQQTISQVLDKKALEGFSRAELITIILSELECMNKISGGNLKEVPE